VLRLIGTAYLVYLGFKAWRAPVSDDNQEAVDSPARPVALGGLSRGLHHRHLEPQGAAFAAAFLPNSSTRPSPRACNSRS
jgi:threonine/homoserine/homoserine lactone efflux protein